MNQHAPEDFPFQEIQLIEDIDLISYTVVEGFLSGLHNSPFLGYSNEFASYRHYIPGDNLRHMDWKLWGRTDKFYVRQFEDDTNLECRIILDASGSMRFGEVEKFKFARIFSGALSCLMARQNDAPGISVIGMGPVRSLPCGTGFNHLESLLLLLSGPTSPPQTAFSGNLAGIGETFRRRGIVVLISDCFDTDQEIFTLMKRLRIQGHEVILFHILAREEMEFPYAGEFAMEDSESGNVHQVNATQFRKKYLKKFNQFLDEIESGCQQVGADYRRILSDASFDKVLIEYLEYRTRVR
jgi:uncharacterized protein (DUF58 family)